MRPTLLTLSFVFIAFGGRLQHSDSAPASRQRVEGETSLPASVRVIGRVLDEEKNGLANVIVGLNYRYHSKTGADGRFVIEAPGPAADLVSFHISPPIYYGKHSREFGFAVSRHQDPLR
ncbi:MAG: hypothetical protein ACKVS6_14450, partial [Planctomycetota bacterium]